jgi:hypothetical protein
VVVPVNLVFNLAGGAAGGAVANYGSLVTSDCKFTGNRAIGADGADAPTTPLDPTDPGFAGAGAGGAITNYGFAIIGISQFTNNLARAGSDGTGDFAAIGSGGAIYNDGMLNVAGSSFNHNRALGGDNSLSAAHNGHALGGAIVSGSLLPLLGGPSAILTVSHSTFDDNQSVGGNGN